MQLFVSPRWEMRNKKEKNTLDASEIRSIVDVWHSTPPLDIAKARQHLGYTRFSENFSEAVLVNGSCPDTWRFADHLIIWTDVCVNIWTRASPMQAPLVPGRLTDRRLLQRAEESYKRISGDIYSLPRLEKAPPLYISRGNQ